MKTATLKLLGLSIIAMISLSCNKNSIDSRRDLSAVEKETGAWFQILKNHLPNTVLAKTKSIIDNLDFTKSAVIKQQKSGRQFFFIRIKENDTKFNEYISFTKTNDNYQTVGVVKVFEDNLENNISNIEAFINYGKLDNNIRLSFYTLDQKHFSSYEGLENDAIKKVIVKNGVKLHNTTINNNRLLNRTSSCTDWYIVTTYTYSDGSQYQTEEYLTTTCEGGDCEVSDPYAASLECTNPGEGGGGGNFDAGSGNDYPDDGKLSCSSFSFKTMTSNMYEAGISGLQFVMDIAGGGNITHSFRNIYIGFPSNTANGTQSHYSAGEAAAISAYAMNKAGLTLQANYFGRSTIEASGITTTQIENEFKNLVQFYINEEINAGSTVTFNQSGINTITRSPVWNSVFEQLWNGLTGSGCN